MTNQVSRRGRRAFFVVVKSAAAASSMGIGKIGHLVRAGRRYIAAGSQAGMARGKGICAD